MKFIIEIIGQITGVGYIIMLIWHFSHTRPTAAELPNLTLPFFYNINFFVMFCFIIAIILLLFLFGIVVHPQLVIVVVLTLLSFGIMLHLWQRITLRMILCGVAISILSFFPGLLNRVPNIYRTIGHLICPGFLFIGGALLLNFTHFAHIRILEKNPLAALRSFGWGVLLAVPPALLNIVYGAHKGDKGIDNWYDPLAALTPGIYEEVWARLFLTTLCYTLLRQTTNNRPRKALIVAVLIGAITHGLAHVSTQMLLSQKGLGYIIAGLLYGVPMGLLFMKRDLEQAIAYHFFIDFIRYIAAYFQI